MKKPILIGITGGTGSGKSTIANLLCHLYSVSDNAIQIDGNNTTRCLL